MELNKFIKLKNILLKKFNKIDKQICKRKRCITFKDIIYCNFYKTANNLSYDVTNSHLKERNILNISKTAIINKLNTIDLSYFDSVNDLVLEHIYENNKPRRIAIDGSKINLLRSLGKDNNGYKLSKNKSYTTALISSLYDIDNKIPINYAIFNHFNERKALISQLKYFRPGDILVVDRGYYDEKLLKILIDNGLYVVFRMKKNLNLIKKLDKTNNNDIIVKHYINDNKYMSMRLLKYKINKETYYLYTNLLDNKKYNFEYLQLLYKNRWGVETDFRYSKYYLMLNNIRLKSINMVKQTICIHNLIQLLEGYLEIIINKSKNDNKNKINKKNSIYMFTNNILYLLFYKKSTKKIKTKILKLMNIIKETIVCIQNNRHYSRIRKFPASKWCLNAIKFINRRKFINKKRK